MRSEISKLVDFFNLPFNVAHVIYADCESMLTMMDKFGAKAPVRDFLRTVDEFRDRLANMPRSSDTESPEELLEKGGLRGRYLDAISDVIIRTLNPALLPSEKMPLNEALWEIMDIIKTALSEPARALLAQLGY